MKNFLATLLAAASVLPLAAGNQFRNSSFELGISGYQLCNYCPLDAEDMSYCKPVQDAATSVHGKYSLKAPSRKDNGYSHIISHELNLTPGKTYTISVWMKSDVPVEIHWGIFGVTHNPPKVVNKWSYVRRKARLTTEWKRYSITFQEPANEEHPFLEAAWRGGTVWFDAIQIEEGTLTDYKPCADQEFAVKGPGRVLEPGKAEFRFAGVNYSNEKADAEISYEIFDNYFNNVPAKGKTRLSLPAKGIAEVVATVPVKNGEFRMQADARLNGKTHSFIPYDFAGAVKLPETPVDADKVFTLGVSGAGSLLRGPLGSYMYRAQGMSAGEWYKMQRRHGLRIDRLHDGGFSNAVALNPNPGEFHFEAIDRAVAAAKGSGVELMPVLGYTWFASPIKEEKKIENWFVRKRSKFNRTHVMNPYHGYLPNDQDWSDFVYAYVKHFKGRIRYYEIVNEPNLFMNGTDYTHYLKLAYVAAKKADPGCRIVGICSTGDLGGALGKFVEDCCKAGALDYLDVLSFHPYSSQLDSYPFPAEKQIAELRKMVEPYKKNVPLWNTELYYIKSYVVSHSSTSYLESEKFPARNTARRYMIDLGGGLMSSISLHGGQIFRNDLRPHFGYSVQWGNVEFIPNAHFVAGNAFARFLEGAKSLKQLQIVNGVNGFLYRDRNGNEVITFWAKYEGESFRFRFDGKGAKLYDLFGNELAVQKEMVLDCNPYYICGKNLDNVLKTLKVIPKRAYTVTGARTAVRNGKQVIAVELKNNTGDKCEYLVRIKGTKGMQKAVLKGNEAKTLYFALPVPKDGKIDVIVADEETMNTVPVKVIPAKILRNGENIKGKNHVFRVTSDEKALYFFADVKDARRGERPENAPWDGDCIELFFDAAPDRVLDRNFYTSGCYRLFAAPRSSNGLPNHFSGSRNMDAKRCSCKISENGANYTAKITVPWNALGMNGPAPVGFDVVFNNSDGKKRESATPWAGNSFNWRDRFNFGIYTPEKQQ